MLDWSALTSQDFEPTFDAFDSFVADDFVVPAGQTWNVHRIDAHGVYFNGPGPAATFNVFFYPNGGTLPGTKFHRDQPVNVNNGSSSTSHLAYPPCLLRGLIGSQMQAQHDLQAGQWGWTDRTVQSNNPAAWQNPGRRLSPCCPTWGVKTVCIRVQRANPTRCSGSTGR